MHIITLKMPHKGTDNTSQKQEDCRIAVWSVSTDITAILYKCLLLSSRGLPLWPSGQSSLLQIQRSGFDSRNYQIFWEVVELGPLSLVSTTEELLEIRSSGSDLENRDYGLRIRHADVAPSIRKSWH
jgi:hypothetical protein